VAMRSAKNGRRVEMRYCPVFRMLAVSSGEKPRLSNSEPERAPKMRADNG
jgi:hypothetical protein